MNYQTSIIRGQNNRIAAVFDSGLSYIYLPTSDLASLVLYWKSTIPNVVCTDMCYFPGSCAAMYTKLGYIEFSFGGSQTFWLNSYQYLIEGSLIGSPDNCFFGFMANSDNSYILGDVFLRYFYQIYDFDNL